MKIAVVIPADGGGDAYRLEVPSDSGTMLPILQHAVGGWIELVPTELPLSVYCNEEGKLQGLPTNYRATHLLGDQLGQGDIIAGNVIVLGPSDSDGETTGLDEEMAESILSAAHGITDIDIERWAKWDSLRARKAAAQTPEELAELAVEEEALREEGAREIIEQDVRRREGWWWLSFAEPENPEGEQFLGVCIVRGGGVGEAASNAWTIGCNPGGQVMGTPIPEEHVPAEEFRNRLLSKLELEEAGLT